VVAGTGTVCFMNTFSSTQQVSYTANFTVSGTYSTNSYTAGSSAAGANLTTSMRVMYNSKSGTVYGIGGSGSWGTWRGISPVTGFRYINGSISNVGGSPNDPIFIAYNNYTNSFCFVYQGSGSGLMLYSGQEVRSESVMQFVDQRNVSNDVPNANQYGNNTQVSAGHPSGWIVMAMPVYFSSFRFGSVTIKPPFTTAPKFVGIATQTVSTGASVVVTINGGANTNVTGLQTGQTYYVGSNGTLVAEGGAGTVAGQALSATSLLVTATNHP